MKKMIFVSCLLQSLLIVNAFAEQEEGSLTKSTAISLPPSGGISNNSGVVHKHKQIAPKVIDLGKKQHRTKPGTTDIHDPRETASIKQIDVQLKPHITKKIILKQNITSPSIGIISTPTSKHIDSK
jgi:hypothetical protein